jgi:hypothetical protein
MAGEQAAAQPLTGNHGRKLGSNPHRPKKSLCILFLPCRGVVDSFDPREPRLDTDLADGLIIMLHE